jgi:hypothetical protein
LAGIKAASGDPIFHLGFFIACMLIPHDQHCDGKNYGIGIAVLASSHFINGFRFVVSSYTPD